MDCSLPSKRTFWEKMEKAWGFWGVEQREASSFFIYNHTTVDGCIPNLPPSQDGKDASSALVSSLLVFFFFSSFLVSFPPLFPPALPCPT